MLNLKLFIDTYCEKIALGHINVETPLKMFQDY